MKIVITTHTQYLKNAYSKHLERAIGLVKRGHKVYFLITSNKNKFKFEYKNVENVYVICSPDLLFGKLRQGLDLWNIINRISILAKLDIDIIHTIDSRPATILPAMYAKYFKGAKLFSEWTDLFSRGGTIVERGSSKFYQKTFGKIEQFFEEGFKKYADGNFTITEKLKVLLHSLSYPNERIEVLPLACNLNNSLSLSKNQYKEKVGFDINKTYLLFGGKIFPRDAEYLLNIYEKLKEKYKDRLVLVFTGKHPWLSEEYKKKYDVIVTGWVSEEELWYYLGATDIHLMPMKITVANIYRFPCKINDYFVAGRPVVSTPNSDLVEINKKYKFGIVTKTDSIEEFVKAIDKLISDPKLLEYCSKESYRCAQEELSMEIIAEKMEKFYKKWGDYNGYHNK